MANSTAVDLGTLDGFMKDDQFSERLVEAVPKFAKLQRDIPFGKRGRSGDLGGDYRFPVSLRRSQGVTYNGGSNAAKAFALNAVVPGVHQECSLSGSELMVRENLSVGAISRGQGGKSSFGTTVRETARLVKEAADFHCELSMLYGGASAVGSGIGDVLTATAVTRTVRLVMTTQTWAPGIWSQLEGGLVEAYTAAGTLIGSGALAYVKSVSADARAITLSGAATAWVASITASTHVVPKGFVTNSFVGLNEILQNTATLFSIDAGTYSLWKANRYDCGGQPLTFSKVLAGINKGFGRGLMDDVTVYVNPYAWTDLNSDIAALRRYNASMKSSAELGTSGKANPGIVFEGTTGAIKLVAHPMVLSGHAFAVATKFCRRIGSTATTFRLDGMNGIPNSNASEFFLPLADNAGVQMRCYWDQAMLITRPSTAIQFHNITPLSIR